MFGDVIGIAMDYAGGLPTHEVAHRIFAEAVDTIEIDAPPGTGLDLFFGDGA
jgi:hypothetical protein